MRVSRIWRLLRLITLLSGRRSLTAGELGRELEVSRRTIFRDLSALEMARIPYYYDRTSGGYKINQHFFLPAVNLTLKEALALLLLAGGAFGSEPVPLLKDSVYAAAKLESVLPEPIREHVGSVIDNFRMNLGPVSSHEGLDSVFSRLAAAIHDKHVCEIRYSSFHEGKQITVRLHPLRMVFHQRAWYLIAYSVKHKELRTFKLVRMDKLTVTSRAFSRDRDPQLDDYFGNAWGMIPEGKLYKVHLHFEPKVAGNVAEVLWHPQQKAEHNDDGSIEYHVTVDGLGEITWWILGYGDQVEVIAPKVLRKRVAEVALAVLEKHT